MPKKIPFALKPTEIIHKRRRMTADTALRLAKYFDNSAKFWLGLQDDYDIEESIINLKNELESIHTIAI